jgi:hypothetical protein
MNDIWQQLDRDGDGRIVGRDTSAFVTMAYNAAADTIMEEEKLLEKYGYKLATDNVGASVPGQRFSRDVAAAKEMAGEKLHQAGQEIHKQMTEPSMQEKMMDRMHRAAWRRQDQQHHQHQQEQQQGHKDESFFNNIYHKLFGQNEQGEHEQGVNVAATELTPGMLAGKDLKPVEMSEGAKEIYEQLRGMETESQGTHHQGIQPQPQQQEQGPPNTLLDIYSFSAKKQPEVQEVQATDMARQPDSRPESASGMTTGMAAGTGVTQRQDQASAMTGMATSTGASQPKPAHPEPRSESGQRQENPLLEEITRPKNPDEFDE